jgi:hypothetical protein
MNLKAVILLCAASSSAFARGTDCQHNPTVRGHCFWVRGSYGMSADNADELMDDDGRGGYAVRAPAHSDWDVPNNLLAAMDRAQRRTGWVSVRIHGDFKVCRIPGTDKFGMTHVCIQSASHLSQEKP